MAENKAKIDIDVREDEGVFLIIDNPEEGPRATRKEVLELIESYGIQDIEFIAISSVFKMTDLHIDILISTNTKVSRTPEVINIEISKDKMEATIEFTPPVNKGEPATVEAIEKAVEFAGIRFGVPVGMAQKLATSREYGKKYVIAQGKESRDGTDGYLEYHFNEKKKSFKPKEMEDGKVDFRNLDLIEIANKGKILVTAHPPVGGSDGINVMGQLVSARAARPTPTLAAGKNVVESEDGTQLVAAEDGQILIEGKKVVVSPLLEINGNVDNSTGNIDFNGSIIIKGNVLTGFVVNSVGNIEVYGVVEGARVTSEHSIILYSGIQGNDRAEIIAGESITTKYAENCMLQAGGDICSDSIMHSNVICGGALILKGRNGLLVGGKIKVAGKVEALTIGSVMATVTEIDVGLDPQKLIEFRTLQSQIILLRGEYEKHDRLFASLNYMERKSGLPIEKKMLLLKTINMRTSIREKIEAHQDRVKDLLPQLDGEGEVITAKKFVYPGVRVLIGNATMQINDRIEHSKLKNVDGRVVVLPI